LAFLVGLLSLSSPAALPRRRACHFSMSFECSAFQMGLFHLSVLHLGHLTGNEFLSSLRDTQSYLHLRHVRIVSSVGFVLGISVDSKYIKHRAVISLSYREMLGKESSSHLNNSTKKCLHNTPKGLAWKDFKTVKLLGFIPYTFVEKECQACGHTFVANTKGVRLTD